MDSNLTLILDSTAFYAAIPFSSSGTFHTTPSVLEEVTKGKSRAMMVEVLVSSGRLQVQGPNVKSVDTIREQSKRVEGHGFLSETDLSVIALAADLSEQGIRSIIITDDYAIQNVAKIMNLEYRPALFKGIRDVGRWLIFCPGCGKSYSERAIKICENCGTKLRRRLQKS